LKFKFVKMLEMKEKQSGRLNGAFDLFNGHKELKPFEAWMS